jgi:hypothetical protein
MSFLGWDFEKTDLPEADLRKRRSWAEMLVGLFSKEFHEITFELMWDSASVNSQAWKLDSRFRVNLYGGLVRHPLLGPAGLALSLAHETGHHLGGPPFHRWLPWLSSESRADCWAAGVGMPRVFGRESRELTLRGAKEVEGVTLKAASHCSDVRAIKRSMVFQAVVEGQAPAADLLNVLDGHS